MQKRSRHPAIGKGLGLRAGGHAGRYQLPRRSPMIC